MGFFYLFLWEGGGGEIEKVAERTKSWSKFLFFNAAILKDSNFNEVDRAECQFTTIATVLDNGSQVWL